MAGRPRSVTPEIAARIVGTRVPGESLRSLYDRLGGAALGISFATLTRFVARGDADGAPAIAAPAAGGLEGSLARALEDDDLPGLVRIQREIDEAMAAWRKHLGADASAVRAYRQLAASRAEVTRAIVELKPRPDVDAERLAALGAKARADLVERARAAAKDDDGLRARLERQQRVIDDLVSRGAS